MKFRQCFLVCALLALALSACGWPGGTTNDASRQFLADRGGSSAPQGAADQSGESMMGVIENVDGRTLHLNRPMLGQTVTVQLAETAKIVMQADVKPGEIQQGDQVTLTGHQQGDVFTADFVQIGTGGALGGGPLAVGAPNAPGAPDSVQSTGESALAGSVGGTVEQIDGTRLTVKNSDGKTLTVQLAEHVSIRKQKQVGLEALETGKFVIASGATKGGSFEIAAMEVLPAPGAP